MREPRWELWKTPDPPTDFVDRVMRRIDEESSRVSWRRRALGRASVVSIPLAAAALALLWVRLAPRRDVAGEISANERTELELVPGMSAVLEQGAHVRWNAERIDQDQGDVFYRASRSQTIRVQTPVAEISGRGPAYRVKVAPISGESVSAVFVSVAQGSVAIQGSEARYTLGAGQYARVERGAIRTDREDDDGEIALALAPERVRSALRGRSRATESGAPVDGREATALAPARPSASSTIPKTPRRTPPPPTLSHPEPIPSASVRPLVLPRCDCDPRTPLCTCGTE